LNAFELARQARTSVAGAMRIGPNDDAAVSLAVMGCQADAVQLAEQARRCGPVSRGAFLVESTWRAVGA